MQRFEPSGFSGAESKVSNEYAQNYCSSSLAYVQRSCDTCKYFPNDNSQADRMKPILFSMPLLVDDFHPIVTILVKNYELDCKMNTINYNFVIQSFQHERSTT